MDENLNKNDGQENNGQAAQPQGVESAQNMAGTATPQEINAVDAQQQRQDTAGTPDGNPEMQPSRDEHKTNTKKRVPAIILSAVAVLAIGFAGGSLANAVFDGHGRPEYRMTAQAEERRGGQRGGRDDSAWDEREDMQDGEAIPDTQDEEWRGEAPYDDTMEPDTQGGAEAPQQGTQRGRNRNSTENGGSTQQELSVGCDQYGSYGRGSIDWKQGRA